MKSSIIGVCSIRTVLSSQPINSSSHRKVRPIHFPFCLESEIQDWVPVLLEVCVLGPSTGTHLRMLGCAQSRKIIIVLQASRPHWPQRPIMLQSLSEVLIPLLA